MTVMIVMPCDGDREDSFFCFFFFRDYLPLLLVGRMKDRKGAMRGYESQPAGIVEMDENDRRMAQIQCLRTRKKARMGRNG